MLADAVLVDWVRVTLPVGSEAELRSRFGAAWVRRSGGWRGWYDRSASVLGCGVGWCWGAAGAGRQGVLVDLPGSACAGMSDLAGFLAWCVGVGGRFVRVDFAVDDRTGALTFERLRAATAAGAVVSLARGWRWLFEGRPGVGEPAGWTLYVGRAVSGAMVRIYDKGAERAAAGAPEVGPWVRVELQCRGDLAGRLVAAVLAGDLGAGGAEIARRVRFVEPRPDTNRWRWSVCEWWASVVGAAARAVRVVAGEVAAAGAERVAAWVRRAVAPSLHALCAVYGAAWLDGVVAEGGGRETAAVRDIVGGAHVVTWCGGGG